MGRPPRNIETKHTSIDIEKELYDKIVQEGKGKSFNEKHNSFLNNLITKTTHKKLHKNSTEEKQTADQILRQAMEHYVIWLQKYLREKSEEQLREDLKKIPSPTFLVNLFEEKILPMINDPKITPEQIMLKWLETIEGGDKYPDEAMSVLKTIQKYHEFKQKPELTLEDLEPITHEDFEPKPEQKEEEHDGEE